MIIPHLLCENRKVSNPHYEANIKVAKVCPVTSRLSGSEFKCLPLLGFNASGKHFVSSNSFREIWPDPVFYPACVSLHNMTFEAFGCYTPHFSSSRNKGFQPHVFYDPCSQWESGNLLHLAFWVLGGSPWRFAQAFLISRGFVYNLAYLGVNKITFAMDILPIFCFSWSYRGFDVRI